MMPGEPLFEQSQQSSQSHRAREAAGAKDGHAPVWLQRLSLVMLVVFCLYIGVLLAVLPWSPRFWDHNAWLLAHPALFHVLRMGWARGIVSGFGLLDVWIGVSEALHYRDHR